MQVGNRVCLVNIDDPSGGTYVSSTANTIGNEGTVTRVDGDWCDVDWDNGTTDCYVVSNLSSSGSAAPVTGTDSVAVAGSGAPVGAEMVRVGENAFCVPTGTYEVVSRDGTNIVLKNSDGINLTLPVSLEGSVIVADKSPDEVINEALDNATAPRPERSMVEYSLSVNREKLEKLTTVPDFPNRDWSKSTSKDEEMIARLRVKGFSVHSISQASGLSYEVVLEITNRILKPE